MDHAVHINGEDNGSRAAKPIVLRLMPGEETVFNLKVVNHGEPSNISLLASSPVSKAIRLRKPDHYVVMEEVIPVMARMPAGKKRLDGEIVLSSPAGKSRVPITLLRDSENQGYDTEPSGPTVDADHLDEDLEEGDLEEGDLKDGDLRDGDLEADGVFPYERGDGEDREERENEADADESDWEGAPRRRKRGKGSDDEDGEEGTEGEEENSEPRRITFTRDQDLQRYRSAGRRKNPAEKAKSHDAGEERDGRLERDRRSAAEGGADGLIVSRAPPRFVTRIDDSFVDKSTRNLEDWPTNGGGGRQDGGGSRKSNPEEADSGRESQGFHQYGDKEGRERLESAERLDLDAGFRNPPQGEEGYGQEGREPDISRDFRPADANGEEREYEREDGREDKEYGKYSAENRGDESDYGDGDDRGALLDRLGGLSLGSSQLIPAIIFLTLVAVLILTFIMEAIPEFAGALASSILIVTLIIYGAAILLKA